MWKYQFENLIENSLGPHNGQSSYIFEKATKFCEIFTLPLNTVHTVKSKVKTLQNCVAFSEHMNFNINIFFVLLWVQNEFRLSKLFWSSAKQFGQVQFILGFFVIMKILYSIITFQTLVYVHIVGFLFSNSSRIVVYIKHVFRRIFGLSYSHL